MAPLSSNPTPGCRMRRGSGERGPGRSSSSPSGRNALSTRREWSPRTVRVSTPASTPSSTSRAPFDDSLLGRWRRRPGVRVGTCAATQWPRGPWRNTARQVSRPTPARRRTSSWSLTPLTPGKPPTPPRPRPSPRPVRRSVRDVTTDRFTSSQGRPCGPLGSPVFTGFCLPARSHRRSPLTVNAEL